MSINQQQEFSIQESHKIIKSQLDSVKETLTFQLYIDLMSVRQSFGKKQGKEFDKESLAKMEEKFVQFYAEKFKEMKMIESSQRKVFAEQYLKYQVGQLLQELENQSKQNDLPTFLKTQQSLITHQTQLISNIEQYLTSLFQRVRHQLYFNEQEEILKYLIRQQNCFCQGKKDIRNIIIKSDAERKIMYDEAREICQTKVKEISKLQYVKKQLEEILKREKSTILELNQRQERAYKKISELTLSLNIKTNTLKNSQTQNQKNAKSSVIPNQEQFKSKNFGSLIYPIPSSSQKESTIFPLQSETSSESIGAICQVPSSFEVLEAQMNSRKFSILLLSILSIVLWFV